MLDALRALLQEAAIHRGILTVDELGVAAGLDMTQPGARESVTKALVAIVREEHASGRPLISVIAIDPVTGYPPAAVLTLARHLGLLRGDDERAIAEHMVAVHEYWSPQTHPSAPRGARVPPCSACAGTGWDTKWCNYCGSNGCTECACAACRGTGRTRPLIHGDA